MSHTLKITIPDEQYEALQAVAEQQGETLENLVSQLLAGVQAKAPAETAEAEPIFDDVDEWFRYLGSTEEEIEESRRRVREEKEMPYDADV